MLASPLCFLLGALLLTVIQFKMPKVCTFFIVLVPDIYQWGINVLKGSPDSVISVNIRLVFITDWIYALYCQQSNLKYVFLDPFNKWFPRDRAVCNSSVFLEMALKAFLTHKAVCLTTKASSWPSHLWSGWQWLLILLFS